LILWRQDKVKPRHNEVLEFLGDSVLNFFISDWLFHQSLKESEGDLSRARSLLVGTDNLLKLAQLFCLEDLLFLGPSEVKKLQKKAYSSLPANAVEAVIGAVYLDQGLDRTKNLVLSWFNDQLKDRDFLFHTREPKSALQHVFQKHYGCLPSYDVLEEFNDGVSSSCRMQISYKGEVLATASGRNKQEASIKAAEKALKKLDKFMLNLNSKNR
jgi:ribonuclease-3